MTDQPSLPLDPIAEARRWWVVRGWEDASAGMAAVTSVARAHQIFMQRIDAVLRPLDLTFARYELLMLLSFTRTGALPMAKIGSRLQVHPTSVTSVVDRLEEQGFVRREQHPQDRRAVLASITDEGRQIAEKATAAMNSDVFLRMGLSSSQTTTLIEILTDLRSDAGDFRL